MLAFYIGLSVGALVALAYVTLAVGSFLRLRRSVLAGPGGAEASGSGADPYEGQGEGFAWKAAGGVIASTLVIVLISAGSAWWYLVPFLAIGSSLAVIAAIAPRWTISRPAGWAGTSSPPTPRASSRPWAWRT